MEEIFRKIRDQMGEDVFFRPGKLISAFTDLSFEADRSERAQRDVTLIKMAYQIAGDELVQLCRSAETSSGMDSAYRAAYRKLQAGFFRETEMRGLLEALLAAFGLPPTAVQAAAPVGDTLHEEAWSAAALEMNEHGYAETWQNGRRCCAYLSDMAPQLIRERQLLQRAYDLAGPELRELAVALQNGAADPQLIHRLQAKLQSMCVGESYIDALLRVMLGAFRQPYELPLDGSTGPGNTAASGPGKKKTDGSKQRRGKKQNSAGGQTSGSGPAHGRTKRKKKVLPTMLLAMGAAALCFFLIVTMKGRTRPLIVIDAAKLAGSSDGTDAPAPENTEPGPVKEEAVMPEAVGNMDYVLIQDVDETVYDERLTELSNYQRIASNRNYVFGLPRTLYTLFHYSGEKLWDGKSLTLEGSDGSKLAYTNDLVSHKYTLDELRPLEIDNVWSKEMDQIQVFFEEEGDKSFSFGLSGIDKGDPNLDVYVYIGFGGGNIWTMCVKIPKPTDARDALIKDYYRECLHSMCGFVGDRPELRLFADYLKEKDPDGTTFAGG